MVSSVALYGVETWTLPSGDIIRLLAFEIWLWRRIEIISWSEIMTNEIVLPFENLRCNMTECIIGGRNGRWQMGDGYG